jgi:hypothetical protein
MKDKKSEYALYIVLAVLIIGAFVLYSMNHFGSNKSSKSTYKADLIKNQSPELSKYRSEDLPEECRLPIYEENISWWKQHLSHHSNTQFCLDYYKDVN